METLDIVKAQVAASVRAKQAILDDSELLQQIADVAELCAAAYRQGGKVIFAGNGGSAADAQHLAGELVSKFYFDRPALPAIALTTDTSVMTAIGNDYGFDHLFARQVEAHGNRGDVFVGISTSGNSRNVVEAVKTCRRLGILSIGLTGSKPCQMDELCDRIIKVPSSETPRIQECQTLIGHILCCIVEERIFHNENLKP
jgi:D-sedoheptulose 7-phosphate isomerase